MRYLSLSLVVLMSLSTVRADDQQAIQGTWYCVALVPGGSRPMDDMAKETMKQMTMTFREKHVSVKMPGRDKGGVFTLDTTTSPKRLVIVDQERDQLKANYVLEHDLLVISFFEGSNEFPKGFSVTKDAKSGMIVLQRTSMVSNEVKAALSTVQTNLKQLGLAVHNYYSAMNVLPRNITDKAGKPLLSWRVQLLPYLEQEALYRQFKLDEPWDSEHNKPLLAQMPKVFAVDAVDEKNHTSSLRPFEGTSTPFESGKDVKFSQILDGLSNTFMFVEATEGSLWTKPEDLAYAANKPLPKLGGRVENQIAAVLLDGRVIAIPARTAEATLRAMITRNGGEPAVIPDMITGTTQRTFEFKGDLAQPPVKK